MEENDKKIEKFDDTSAKILNILGGGSGLVNAPLRLIKTLNNTRRGIQGGFQKFENAKEREKKAKALAQAKKQKQEQMALKQKQAELEKQKKLEAKEKLAQTKAENRRLDMIDKATAKMPINQFEMPKSMDVNQVMGEAKQQQVAKFNQQAQKRLPQFNKQAQKVNFPSNNPNDLKRSKPLDVGAKMNQFKANQNKAIAKGLANPVADPTGAKQNKKIAKGLQKEFGTKIPKKQPAPVNMNGNNDFETKLKNFWKID